MNLYNFIDLHLFGNINYYKYIKNNTPINIINPRFSKGWWHNKFSIIGANGIINLSVPIVGGRNQHDFLSETAISYSATNWQQQHTKTIKSCYGNAPFFDYYFPYLQDIFTEKWTTVYELNVAATKLIAKLLKLNIHLIDTPTTVHESEIAFSKYYLKCNEIEATLKPYQQVFENKHGFVTNLSILDLLMCEGPNAAQFL